MYILLALIAMIGYGITSIIYKLASKSIDPVSLTLFTSVFTALTVFVYWLFLKEKDVTIKGIEYAGIAGIIAGFSFIAFVTAIHFGKVSIVSTIRGLSFLVTAAIALIFLAEKLTLMKAAGVVLAAVSLLLLAL